MGKIFYMKAIFRSTYLLFHKMMTSTAVCIFHRVGGEILVTFLWPTNEGAFVALAKIKKDVLRVFHPDSVLYDCEIRNSLLLFFEI